MLQYKIDAAAQGQVQAQDYSTEESIPFDKFMAHFNEDLGQHKWNKKHECSDKQYQKQGWKCTIHTRPQDNSKVNLIRVDAKLKNIKQSAIQEYFNHEEEDEDEGDNYKLIEECKNGDIVYYTREKFPMISDRDDVKRAHGEKVNGV